MKYVGCALLGVTAVLVACGLVGPEHLVAQADRVWSVLLFAVAITITATLADAAGVFGMAAGLAARAARGRTWLLWLFVIVLALASTVFLSLDTAAVLLTPIVVLVARRARLDPLPFALTTVWLANTGSLLLPVSNLTNLLALHRLGTLGTGSGDLSTGPGSPSAEAGQPAGDPSVLDFAGLTWAPALACALVPVVLLALIYRGRLFGRFRAFDLPPAREHDRPLLGGAAVGVVVLLPALASGIDVWIPACAAAVALLGLFAWRRPAVLSPRLVPWSFLIFAVGLFAASAAATGLGLSDWLVHSVAASDASGPAFGSAVSGGADAAGGAAAEAPGGDGLGRLLGLALGGALAANAIDNLPAYLALEAAAGTPKQLVALLIGVNAGPLITPWASLAVLLWHRQLTGLGVEISWRRYLTLGLMCAPLTVLAGTCALALT